MPSIVSLKKGTCEQMLAMGTLASPFLQVVEVLQYPLDHVTGRAEYELIVSDGFHFIHVVLHQELHGLVETGELRPLVILAVRKYFTVELCSFRIATLLDVLVISSSPRLYGTPIPLDVSVDPENALKRLMQYLIRQHAIASSGTSSASRDEVNVHGGDQEEMRAEIACH